MQNSETSSSDIAELSFEDSLRELEQIVKNLENGDASLEQSINDYTKGTALKAQCEAKLKEAELKVRQIKATNDGIKDSEPFNAS